MSDTEVASDTTASGFDFDELVHEYHQCVRLFLARYFHCPQQIDDLAQETFVAAFKQKHLFEGRSKPSTWLIGIARNKALQFMRLEQRRKAKVQKFADSSPGFRELYEGTPESLADDSLERVDALKHCLGRLPPHLFELVEQFYFGGITAVTIAANSGAKESAIRMKLKRTRDVLQKCIRVTLES